MRVRSTEKHWINDSLRLNKVASVEPADTLADSINDSVTEDMLKLVEETLDDVVLVSEDKIID